MGEGEVFFFVARPAGFSLFFPQTKGGGGEKLDPPGPPLDPPLCITLYTVENCSHSFPSAVNFQEIQTHR